MEREREEGQAGYLRNATGIDDLEWSVKKLYS
jgi:hypothetical protein